MLWRSLFGNANPAFRYELLSTALSQPISVPASDSVTLLLPGEMGMEPSETITVGNRVTTGQRLTWNDATGPAVLSTITGTIKKVEPHIGDYGRNYTAITIEQDGEQTWDDRFEAAARNLTPQVLSDYLSSAPGNAPLDKLLDQDKPIDTLVIYGGDTDLLVETNLYILKSRTEAVNQGIKALKSATGIEKVIVAVPAESLQNIDGHFAAEVKAVPAAYPGAQPLMILYHLTGRMLEQGQTCQDIGILFIRAEAVAAIGKAVTTGQVPTEKIVTVVDQAGNRNLVSVCLGTPVGEVFKRLNITTAEGDRIIFGGPMTGRAIYSEQQPITADCDAVMVQDHGRIILSGDDPCINCGECIRTCPTNVPVNLLIRFLEADQYQEAADLYDLYSCVECGLCSFVCPARIPILQYIKLAKFELARVTAEEEND
jgi:electron transport complex protein RnfC